MSSRVIVMREATIRIVKMLAEKDVKVTQRGAKAFVEYAHSGRPVRVNIPYIPDDASEELLDAIQGFMDHEVAHILFTDYRALMDAKKAGVSRLHNIIEDSFIERKMAQHFAGSGLNLQNVGSFFLKTYTDVELAANPDMAEGLLFVPAVRAWAGQHVFADYMADKWHLIESVTNALGDEVKEIANCATSDDCLKLSIKFRDLLEAAKPKRPAPPPSPEPGPESEGDDESSASKAPGKPGKGTAELDPTDSDEEIPDLDVGDYTDGATEGEEPEAAPDELPTEGESPEEAGPDSADDEDVKTVDDEEAETPPSDAVDADIDMEERDHGRSVDDGDAESDSAEDGDLDGAGDASPEDTTMSGPGEEDLDETSGTAPSASDDGERDEDAPSVLDRLHSSMGDKDYDDAIAEALTRMSAEAGRAADYLVYTTELDVIEPMEVGSHLGRWSEAYLKSMTDEVDHMVGPLQKDLERAVAARSAATWSAGHRSGRLHPSALSRLTMFNDDRVFRRRHVNESKDVAVELLVDCSGSMTGAKIKTAAYAAYGLCAVLDRMGIANEVMGFTTQESFPAEMRAEEARLGVRYARRETLYHPILKSFSERLTGENKKRFAALPTVNWLNENVDGESVQIAASRLAVRREKRKILMVLSDGQPACPGDREALYAHLKKSVKDVERSGIDVIGIGIQSDAPRHFYSKYVLLDSVAQLPDTVIGKIKELLMKF